MKHSIFAMEVCARFTPEMHGALLGLVRDAPERMSLQAKWAQYQGAALIVFDNLARCERGCWDYFNDDARALKDYKMWTDGMLTEEGARRDPSGAAGPYRGGEPRYLTFTMALLIQQETFTDRAMIAVCNVVEADLWKRATFARILRGVAQISFASVVSDVMYLIPRDDPWGLTDQDLQAEKFEYLRPLSD